MQTTPRPAPSREKIALLPEFARLGMAQISVVSNAAQAHAAALALREHKAWGFDTESKPTFVKEEASTGPHILQLATLQHAWVFVLHEAGCTAVAAALLADPQHTKAGFGLGDDTKRIRAKLGVEPAGVLELNAVLSARGHRRELGVKGAVAVLFGQRFIKSKKAATSNWANLRLTEAQIIYAANDAYAAARVHAALAALDVGQVDR